MRGATQTVPHIKTAGISLVERGGRVESYVPSSQVARELDELQNELGEPISDGVKSGDVV